MTTLTLRRTKGSSLTYDELDDNFMFLANTVFGGSFETNLSYNPTLRELSSSTGTGTILPLVSANNAGLMTEDDKIKLDSVEFGATVSTFTPTLEAKLLALDTNEELRDRTTHTGFQSSNTIFDFAESVDALLERFYDISVYVADKPIDGEIVYRMKAVRAFSFPINLIGSKGDAETGSSGNVVFTLFKNGVSFGTVRFNVSTLGSFTAASATSFAIDDILSISAPATADASLRNIAIVLQGTVL